MKVFTQLLAVGWCLLLECYTVLPFRIPFARILAPERHLSRHRRNLSSVDANKEYVLRFDGGSRGNPGLAGSGAVLYVKEGDQLKEVWHGCFFLGDAGITNNVAEYAGLINGLRWVSKLPINFLRIEGDSELIIKQMKGVYRVKSEKLQELQREAVQLAQGLGDKEFVHIPRAKNSRADELSNLAMDTRRTEYSTDFGSSYHTGDVEATDQEQTDVISESVGDLNAELQAAKPRKTAAKAKSKAPRTDKNHSNRHRMTLVPIFQANSGEGDQFVLIAETMKTVRRGGKVKSQRVFEFISIVYDTNPETHIAGESAEVVKSASQDYGETLLHSFLQSSKLEGGLIPFETQQQSPDTSADSDIEYFFEFDHKPAPTGLKESVLPGESPVLEHGHITTMDYGNGNIRLVEPTLKAADLHFQSDHAYLLRLDADTKKILKQVEKINKLYDTDSFDAQKPYLGAKRRHNFPDNLSKLDVRRILVVPVSKLLKVLHGASERGVLVDSTLYGWSLGYDQCLAMQNLHNNILPSEKKMTKSSKGAKASKRTRRPENADGQSEKTSRDAQVKVIEEETVVTSPHV